MRRYYVYIMSSKSRALYIGITNDIYRRVWEHKNNSLPGFTNKYRIHRLVYFESFKYVGNAIARENSCFDSCCQSHMGGSQERLV